MRRLLMKGMSSDTKGVPDMARSGHSLFPKGHLIGKFPLEFVNEFLTAFRELHPYKEIALLSSGDEVEFWTMTPMSLQQFEAWDQVYEKLCKELKL